MKAGVLPCKCDFVPSDAEKSSSSALCDVLGIMDMGDANFTIVVLLRGSWQSAFCQVEARFGCGWGLKCPELPHAWLPPAWPVLLLVLMLCPSWKAMAEQGHCHGERAAGRTDTWIHYSSQQFKGSQQTSWGSEDDWCRSPLTEG